MTHNRDALASKQINNETKLRRLIVISLVILGVIYYLPMFSMEGIISSDDTTFHLGRLVGLSNVWVSPVNFDSFGKNGLMVNIFYPWLTMYPMHILYKITGSYVAGYKLYYTLLTVATLLIAYWSVREIAKSRAGAYVFAVLYSFSNYRYADIFNRGSLGEAIALAFLPLVLLGIYRVCLDDHEEWFPLAGGMILIAYSHVLTLLMSAVFTGILYLATLAFQDRKKERLVSLVKAAALSAGVSAAMMIPMLEQFMRNTLHTPGGNGRRMSMSAYSLTRIIKYSLLNNPEGRGIGLLTGIAAFIACVLLVKRAVTAGRLAEDERRMEPEILFSLLLMLTGGAILLCTTDLLPWFFLGESTPVSVIQFAWRLNAYIILSFTAAFAVLISKEVASSRRGTALLLAVVVVSAAGIQFANLYRHAGMETEKPPIKEEEIAKWQSGSVDYAPEQAKEFIKTHWKTMEFIYTDDGHYRKSPTTEKNGTYYEQEVVSPRDDAVMDIPVYRYYGQRVLLNGEPAESRMSKRGTTEVSGIPAGGSVIRIFYRYTPVARAAWLFSICVLIYGRIVITRKRKEKGGGEKTAQAA